MIVSRSMLLASLGGKKWKKFHLTSKSDDLNQRELMLVALILHGEIATTIFRNVGWL
jgi:hypothetical protein